METFCLSTVWSHDFTLPWQQANYEHYLHAILLLNKLQSGTDNTNIMCCKKFGKIFKTCLACDGIIGVTVLLLVNEYAIHVH